MSDRGDPEGGLAHNIEEILIYLCENQCRNVFKVNVPRKVPELQHRFVSVVSHHMGFGSHRGQQSDDILLEEDCIMSCIVNVKHLSKTDQLLFVTTYVVNNDVL